MQTSIRSLQAGLEVSRRHGAHFETVANFWQIWVDSPDSDSDCGSYCCFSGKKSEPRVEHEEPEEPELHRCAEQQQQQDGTSKPKIMRGDAAIGTAANGGAAAAIGCADF